MKAEEKRVKTFQATLAENRAVSLQSQDDTQSRVAGNAVRRRCWELNTKERQQNLLECLNAFTSAKNSKEQWWVDEPECDGEAWSGRWRQVNAVRIRLNGKPWIVQTLARVFWPKTTAELAKLEFRKTRDNEILETFGFGPGTQDVIAVIVDDLNPDAKSDVAALTDASLVTALTGAGWTYVSRRFEETQQNTASLTVVLQKIAWSAFDVAAPDITEYENKTTQHETITQTWIGINKADALSGLYTTVSTKFNAMAVRIVENGKGAITINRTQIHEVYGAASAEIEAAEARVLNVHGLETGTLNTLLVINENLLSKASAYGTLATGETGYTLEDSREELGENGLWNKYYIYTKATWTNWDTQTTAPARIVQTGKSNVGGYAEGKSEQASGVPIASAESALAALTADTGYVLENMQWQERGQGEAEYSFEQRAVFDYGSGATVSAPARIYNRNYLSGQTNAAHFCWFRVSASRIDAVETAAKLIANYGTWFTGQYGSASGWRVSTVEIDRNGDGSANVVAEVKIPTTDNTAPEDWDWTQAADEPTPIWSYIRDEDGIIVYQIEYYKRWAARTSMDDAIDWLNSLTSVDLVDGTGWTRMGENKYLAVAIWINSEVPGPP